MRQFREITGAVMLATVVVAGQADAVLLLVSPSRSRGQSGSIPTPESVLGFQPGADFKLANYEQVVELLPESRRRERPHDAGAGGEDVAGPDVSTSR